MSDDKTPRKGGYDSAPPERYIGKLDGYYLIKRLGGGGIGDVYLAVGENNSEMRRALKIVKTNDAGDMDEIIARWRVECKVSERVRALKHPHIVQVYDGKAVTVVDPRSNDESQIFYLTMEYVEGRTLHDMIRGTPPTLDEGIKIGTDIAGALEAAHSIGVVHRDIKPSNVMVDDAIEGKMHAYLLDFGIAKLLSDPSGLTELHGEAAIGTLQYMPPEELIKLIRNSSVEQDERGDVWSLGKVLYELFGRIAKPYSEPTQASKRSHSLEDAAKEALAWLPNAIPEIPRELNELIYDMTKYRPDLRPGAQDVRAELGRILRSRDVLSGTQPITLGPKEVRLDELIKDMRNEHMTDPEFARKQGLFIMVGSEGYFQATHPNVKVDSRYARETTYFKIFAPPGKSEWVFGRGEDVDCRYAERTMSRKHFKIVRTGLSLGGDGVFKIVDLNSNNGTKLNGIALQPNQPELILSGYRISAGNLDLTFALPTHMRKNTDTMQFPIARDAKTPQQKRSKDSQSGA